MDVFVGFQSAIEYWRGYGSAYSDFPDILRTAPSFGVAPDAARSFQLLRGPLNDRTEPLSVLVSDAGSRRRTGKVRCRMWSTTVPSGAFVRVGASVYVSSPEFTFAQIARDCTLVELIKIGYELCGMYALSNGNDLTIFDGGIAAGFRYRNPVTTVRKLSAFLKRAKGSDGLARARRAVKYIIDNSASPRETELAMILTLPFSLGGYGLPAPMLNCQVDLGVKSVTCKGPTLLSLVDRQAQKNEFRICDLYWADAKLDIEYDSDFYHVGAEKIAQDANRRNDLESRGITVITVTNKQILSWKRMDEVACHAAKRIGKRIRQEYRFLTPERRELRKALFVES